MEPCSVALLIPARLRPDTLGRSSKRLITTGCKWVSANARRYHTSDEIVDGMIDQSRAECLKLPQAALVDFGNGRVEMLQQEPSGYGDPQTSDRKHAGICLRTRHDRIGCRAVRDRAGKRPNRVEGEG